MGKEKFDDFLINTGLYISIPFSEEDIVELAGILYMARPNQHNSYRFDIYCPFCNKASICYIDGKEEMFYRDISSMKNKYRQVYATCTRDTSHRIHYWFLTSEDSIMKIGQYPPVPDILSNRISKYRNTLKDEFIELKTAIQLHSHGVGIGAFVYLRRIFENLIVSEFEQNKTFITEADSFYQKRMEEKLEMLKPYIPSFITNNKAIYGIISKGIHELDEYECLDFFPVLIESIEMILDQKIKLKEEKEKEKLLSKAISNISSKIRNSTP